MTIINRIPIQNIYYLLCYAWNKLEERDIVNVERIDTNNILDLFAKVLINGMNHLFKRGLDRGYITLGEESKCLKGKLCFSPTLKRKLLVKASVFCEHDDLSYNVLHNQLIRSTIKGIIDNDNLDSCLRSELIGIYRKLRNIDDIAVNQSVFSRIQLHQNNSFYDFIIKICELIYYNELISEDHGKSKFRDFFQDENRMPHMFEDFIRNFYKLETVGLKVGREEIPWKAEALTEQAAFLLPKMITDVSIEGKDTKLIIEVKYTYKTLSIHFNQEKIHSNHLYQLNSYLSNIKAKDGMNENCIGVLLYPTVDRAICEDLLIGGHKVMIRTIDLCQPWKSIHAGLIEIISNVN